MGLLKLCQGRVTELPAFGAGPSESHGHADASLPEAPLTSARLSARKGSPQLHTQFLDTPIHAGGNCRSDVGFQFLCGPQALQQDISAHPTAFIKKNTLNLRFELPPGFNVERVTQLPLFEDGKVEAGHAIGRDINVSIANENSYFHRQRTLQRAGLREPDEDNEPAGEAQLRESGTGGSDALPSPVDDEAGAGDEDTGEAAPAATSEADDRLVVRGDEWPSEMSAIRQARSEHKAELEKIEKMRREEAMQAQSEEDRREQATRFSMPSLATSAMSGSSDSETQGAAATDQDDAGTGQDAGSEDHGDSATDSALARRVAALEADNQQKEEQLKAMTLQVQERVALPTGQKPSICCQCDGVVTYAPHGRCTCPYGDAESRAAPAGCQAAVDASYKGTRQCASACREVFWGKELTRAREEESGFRTKAEQLHDTAVRDAQAHHEHHEKHAQHSAVQDHRHVQEHDEAAKHATSSQHHERIQAPDRAASQAERHEQREDLERAAVDTTRSQRHKQIQRPEGGASQDELHEQRQDLDHAAVEAAQLGGASSKVAATSTTDSLRVPATEMHSRSVTDAMRADDSKTAGMGM